MAVRCGSSAERHPDPAEEESQAREGVRFSALRIWALRADGLPRQPGAVWYANRFMTTRFSACYGECVCIFGLQPAKSAER